ncbi:MAG: hypothetical protein HC850_11205 [Rhodomicrobium sp.]|nr:hypothetical protein [Rhodomicrobium sp.]
MLQHSAEPFPDRVELAWELGGSLAAEVEIYRAKAPGNWRSLGTPASDGTHRVVYTDRDVEPGRN